MCGSKPSCKKPLPTTWSLLKGVYSYLGRLKSKPSDNGQQKNTLLRLIPAMTFKDILDIHSDILHAILYDISSDRSGMSSGIDIYSDILFWNSIWHIVYLKDIQTIYSDILYDIYSDILFWHSIWQIYILSDIYFQTFYLAFYLTYILAFYLAYTLAFYLTYILAFYLFWHSISHLLTFYLAFYLTYILAFYLRYILRW